jgi:putative acetyltransferase
MTINMRPGSPEDAPVALAIWRAATSGPGHDFLTPADRQAIDREVAAMFDTLDYQLVLDTNGRPVAFLIADGDFIDGLFVDPAAQGQGVGRAVIEQFMEGKPSVRLDVNEDNTQALGFYQRLGFQVRGRSEVDGQGRPYPLLHLERNLNSGL